MFLSAVILGAVAVAGLAMVAIGLVGKRLDDHPICRRCKFDLVGVYGGEGAEQKCPECGSILSAQRVRIGRRKRRAGFVAVGALLLTIPAGIGGAFSWGAVSGFDWNTIKPAWLLQREASSADEVTSQIALVELHSRLSEEGLSDGRIRSLVEVALGCQADLKRAWNPLWGDLIEIGRDKGLVDDEQWGRYFLQSVPVESLSVTMRKRVRVGDAVPYELSLHHPRLGHKPGGYYWLSLKTLRVGFEGGIQEHRGVGFGGIGVAHHTSSTFSSGCINLDLPVGTHRVFTEMRFCPAPEQMQTLDGACRDVRFEETVSVVPAGTQIVDFVSNSELAGEMRDSVAIRYVNVTPQGDGTFLLGGTIEFTSHPIDVAFDVVLHADDKTFDLGRIAARSSDETISRRLMSPRLERFDVRTGDVVLRPSVEAALEAPGIERIWGEEIHFEDVTVLWPER